MTDETPARPFNPNVLIEQNAMKAMRDGPRLRTDYHTPVVARDRKNGNVLLGGLGCMGVGMMWFREADRTGGFKDYPGYDEAPEQDSRGGFGLERVQL